MAPTKSRRVGTVIAAVIVIAAIGALVVFLLSPKQAARRAERRQAARDRQEFTARFDSLCKARLYPVLWRSGTFTTTEFDEERRTWNLTVSSADWSRRDAGSKKDLAAKLLTTFSSVRAQAGGDPDEAALVISDESGEQVAEATPSGGTSIHR
jgi:hypothetical protein